VRPLLFAAIVIGATSADARPSLDSERLGRLGQYEVLVFADPAGSGLEKGKAIGVFDATPEEVYRVVTDYAKWKDYLPKVRDSSVLERSGEEALVATVAELPWPVGAARVEARYVQARLRGEIYRIEFSMVRGSMRRYRGTMYIEPWTAGKAAVTYELVAEPDFLVPKGRVNRMVLRSASGFVHALRQRVNELHRLGYLHPLPPRPPLVPRNALPLGPATVKR
jgi:ribosome-associated toxin RatA of RatAB toxin-antitoxin module